MQALFAAQLLVMAFAAPLQETPAPPGKGIVLPEEIGDSLTRDTLWKAWPSEARSIGLESDIGLRCVVNLTGRLEQCVVEREPFQGLGFGTAARTLANGMRYKPGTKDGEAVPMSIQISVPFNCNDRCKPLDRSEMTASLVMNATWATAPTVTDVAKAYPPAALANKLDGAATLMCRLGRSGAVGGCKITEELPLGQGFGEAAKSLAPKFTMTAKLAGGVSPAGSNIRIPFRFKLANNGQASATGSPDWRSAPSSAEFLDALPSAAKLAGQDGRAVLSCITTADGGLTDCTTVSNVPEGLGFAEAALSLTPKFRMSIWSKDGLPTVGARIRLPFIFKLDTVTEAQVAAAKAAPPPLLITNPDWVRKPTGAEIAQYYPSRAALKTQGGIARINCAVLVDGAINDCSIVSESPIDWGFGDAAMRMSKLFRLRPTTVDGQGVSGARVTIPIQFRIY